MRPVPAELYARDLNTMYGTLRPLFPLCTILIQTVLIRVQKERELVRASDYSVGAMATTRTCIHGISRRETMATRVRLYLMTMDVLHVTQCGSLTRSYILSPTQHAHCQGPWGMCHFHLMYIQPHTHTASGHFEGDKFDAKNDEPRRTAPSNNVDS